jgi:hypothetical protein
VWIWSIWLRARMSGGLLGFIKCWNLLSSWPTVRFSERVQFQGISYLILLFLSPDDIWY